MTGRRQWLPGAAAIVPMPTILSVKDIPVVFTIHNIGYHGVFPPESLDAPRGISASAVHPGGIEFSGNANFLKGGSYLFGLPDGQ